MYMSIHTTPPIDPAHPLAKLIERSIKAHKLPSCEGCKYGGIEFPVNGGDAFMFCDLDAAKGSPIALDDHRSAIEVVNFAHFCAAWEAKA